VWVWEKIVKDISKKQDTKKIVSFLWKAWVVNIDENEKKVYIWVPNNFISLQVKKFLKKDLQKAVKQVYSIKFDVQIVEYTPFQSNWTGLQLDLKKVLGVKKQEKKSKKIDKSTKDKLESYFGVLFEKKYQFSNFVSGGSTQLAYSAAQKVAEQPGQVYNPFFIYGNVGLGKTHLLQSIGNYVIENFEKKVVVYLPTTRMIDEIINAIRSNKLQKLQKKLNQVDILILDDIQFLANKEKTQEIFHNIFNNFHSQNKQIILSSDRPPRELTLLEPRLRSRFANWLVTDVKKPDFETRLAILESKLKAKWQTMDKEYLDLIAKYVDDNIRELQGALNIVLTKKTLLEDDLTKETIYQALETLWYTVSESWYQNAKIENAQDKNPKWSKNYDKIVEYVANYYDLSVKELKSDSRKRSISQTRQMLMYIWKTYFNWTLEKIAEYFGGKNHATVIYAVKNFPKKIQKDDKLYEDFQKIKDAMEL